MMSSSITDAASADSHLFDDQMEQLTRSIHDLQVEHHCVRFTGSGTFLRVFPLPVFNTIQKLVCLIFAVESPIQIPLSEQKRACSTFEQIAKTYLKYFEYECIQGNVR